MPPMNKATKLPTTIATAIEALWLDFFFFVSISSVIIRDVGMKVDGDIGSIGLVGMRGPGEMGSPGGTRHG